jgi:threonine dehydrogenase-like Zn-dependent dehydrogenase
LFLKDIFPTGWMAADNCEIEPADIVAIWGCGPVGQFCIKSALMLGAARVIVIDNVPERLALARLSGAETIDFDTTTRQRCRTPEGRARAPGPGSCTAQAVLRPAALAAASSVLGTG